MKDVIYSEKMSHPTNSNIEVTFEAITEYKAPMNHFECIEDVEFARNEKNSAAWFTACITVKYKGVHEIEGTDYLGCCSYKSFSDFYEGGYLEDMIANATDQLESRITVLKMRLKELDNA